jgi:hypothetical protein
MATAVVAIAAVIAEIRTANPQLFIVLPEVEYDKYSTSFYFVDGVTLFFLGDWKAGSNRTETIEYKENTDRNR